jgi:hypothetical protein
LLDTYNCVDGFLAGSAYNNNQVCNAAVSGMAYYGLKTYQATSAGIVPNPIAMSIDSTGLTQQYSIFYAYALNSHFTNLFLALAIGLLTKPDLLN